MWYETEEKNENFFNNRDGRERISFFWNTIQIHAKVTILCRQIFILKHNYFSKKCFLYEKMVFILKLFDN